MSFARFIYLGGLFFLAFCLPVPVAAQLEGHASDSRLGQCDDAKKPAAVFESLFGPSFRKAGASRDTTDDIELIKTMLMAARQLKDEPAVVAILCDRTYQLASRSPDGIEFAVEAMKLLAATSPIKAESAMLRLDQTLRRGFMRATGERRTKLGQQLVDFLVSRGDVCAESSDFGGAAKQFQLALRIADMEEGVDAVPVRAKFTLASEREKVERSIESALQKLSTSPTDRAANSALMKLYLLEMDMPARAVRFAKFSGDEKAISLLPLLVKSADELVTAELLSLGDWYQELLEEAGENQKPAILTRCRRLYERVLLIDELASLDRIKATLNLNKVRAVWKQMYPELTKSLVTIDGDGWADALQGLELKRYRRSGVWEFEDDLLTLTAAAQEEGVEPETEIETEAKAEVENENGEEAKVDSRTKEESEQPSCIESQSTKTEVLSGRLLLPVAVWVGDSARAEKSAVDDRAGWMDRKSNLRTKVVSAFDFEAKFTRYAGDGEVVIILPVGGRSLPLVVGAGMGGRILGVDADREVGDATNATDRNTIINSNTLENEREYTLAARVKIDGAKASVTVVLNGEALVKWSGRVSEISENTEWSLRDVRGIGIGAKNATVSFHSLRIRALHGDVRLLPKPKMLHEREFVTIADGEVDLLQEFESFNGRVSGGWKFSKEDGLVLAHNTKVKAERYGFPVSPKLNPGDSYTYRIKFRIDLGGDSTKIMGGPMLLLPLGETGVGFFSGIGEEGTTTGLSLIDEKQLDDENPTYRNVPQLQDDCDYVLEARLSRIADEVAIEVDIDELELVRWKGEVEQVVPPSSWGIGNPSRLGLGAVIGSRDAGSIFVVSSATFKLHKGVAVIGKGVKKAVPVVKVKLEHDPKPVDVVSTVDAKKHRGAGIWTVSRGGALATEVKGDGGLNEVMLPVVPRGDYELRFKLLRQTGRAVTRFYLPVGSRSCELVLGYNDGKSGAISQSRSSDSYGYSVSALTSTKRIRFFNGKAYDVKVSVSTKDSISQIVVSINGMPYLKWKGAGEKLSSQFATVEKMNPKAFRVAVYNPVIRSSISLSGIQLKMTTGAPLVLP